MSINLLKKLVSSVVSPETVKPTQRKPPQRVRAINAPSSQTSELSVSRIPSAPPQEKMLIPATWNEVIENPRVWAEIRPLIVDED